ncbi:uncharacterized protein LOC133483003 isoform X2 [Phyllopteryx taeniolatus]|uniref:uncharacterized protein LOC133483003 isoform X2 n=1 Tax=Phyllopteryx taeniolatus TaxID=161469 RepID=UPI002AD50F08|nr:uncharacterized protein LOC133483003 isoform X2 [Phyllopteryx taeniolatus]
MEVFLCLSSQIVNAVFTALVVVPQLYVMARPTSARYCKQPLLNSLTASIALSLFASGFSVVFTLIDPVPQGLWASCHVFGLLSFGHGVCCAIMTLAAAACAKTTPELYHMSLFLTVASILSTGKNRYAGGQRRTVADKKAVTMSNETSPAVSHGHRIALILTIHAVSMPPASR